MIFENPEKQVEGMLKMGLNDIYWALKVNICSILHSKLDLAPKNLVEASFLIIYTLSYWYQSQLISQLQGCEAKLQSDIEDFPLYL